MNEQYEHTIQWLNAVARNKYRYLDEWQKAITQKIDYCQNEINKALKFSNPGTANHLSGLLKLRVIRLQSELDNLKSKVLKGQ